MPYDYLQVFPPVHLQIMCGGQLVECVGAAQYSGRGIDVSRVNKAGFTLFHTPSLVSYMLLAPGCLPLT